MNKNKFHHIINTVFNWARAILNHQLYGVQGGYKHRENCIPYDDRSETDNWQKEVYEFSDEVCQNNGYQSIIDFGCGSGYKLINILGNYNTLGLEIDPILTFLNSKYPENKWASFDVNRKYETDLLIISDVIEHIKEPDMFLNQIIKAISFKKIIISTPDRDLLPLSSKYGPPINLSHHREWSFNEFRSFISEFIEVEKHFISNHEQSTQLILGKC